MRLIVLLTCAAALSGCLREPTAAELQLQAACDAGNLSACETVYRQEQAERAAIGQMLMSQPMPQAQPIPPVAPPARLQTYCYSVGNTLTCY